MAKIISPSDLVLSTTKAQLGIDGNVWIDTPTFKVDLGLFGSLSTDGVSLQALYSFIKEQWKTNALLPMFKFPIDAITGEQFEFVNGWDFEDNNARYLIRDGGWALKSILNVVQEEWMNVTTLGAFDAGTDQAYYIHTADGTPTNFVLAGEVNQAVQIYGDGSHGAFDYRLTASSEFVVFLREQGKTYATYNLNIDQAKTSLTYRLYAMPLSNGTDLNITASDASMILDETSSDFSVATNVITAVGADFTGLAVGDSIVLGSTAGGTNDGTYTIKVWTSSTVIEVNEAMTNETSTASVTIKAKLVYALMDITWGAIQIDFGSGNRDFGILIDGNSGTAEEIYEYNQYQLRLGTDIDEGAGTEIGRISDSQLEFVGSTLKTKLTADGGVYIENFLPADTNRIVFVDDLGVERTYPFVAAGTIGFNPNLVDATDGTFWMFFTDANGNAFNTAAAIIVDDDGGTDINGSITGASVAFTFDYDGNVQGGRTPVTDADVTLVAIATDTAQYVLATGTIGRSTLNVFTMTAALERNYVA